MILEKIQLKNIQKHSFLELTFSKDLNVITGESGTGKTGLFRGLQWALNFSDVSFSDIRKEGTKESSVKIWLDNGFQVERYRSDSVNRYILSKEGYEDQVFDNFGDTTPEEIQKIIGIQEIEVDGKRINLNFASQDDINFIFDKNISGPFRAKIFNKLTGTEGLDIMFKDCNKDTLRVSREIKETEEKLQSQEDELVSASNQYNELKNKLDIITKKWHTLQEDINIYEEMVSLAEKLKTNKETQEFTQFKLSQIKVVADSKISDLKNQAEHLSKLVELNNSLTSVNNRLRELNEKKVKYNNADFESLKKDAVYIDTLKKYSDNLVQLKKKENSLVEEMRRINETISANEAELKKVWKECNNVCPLCKGIKNETKRN